jgi:hypothetical protein
MKTIKIKTFIDEYAKKYIHKKNYESKFANLVKHILNNQQIEPNINFNTKKDILLQKINTNKNEPLLYKIFKDLDYPNNKSKNYKYFLTWYRENSTEINLKNVILSHKYYDILYNPTTTRKKLHDLLYKNPFVFLDIIHCAETYNLIYNEYHDNKNLIITNIFSYHIENKEKPNILLVVQIINFFRTISKKNMNIDLTIFFSNQKRYLPDKNEKKLLTPENINAGVTLSGDYVYVWRKEEFYKVLIHELIHYFSIDFHDLNMHQIEKIRDNIININGEDAANEAYTEILAITIHSVLYSIIHKMDFSEIINYEIVFTHLQIAKIINFFGGKTYEDLYNIQINQKTSVVSYVIIKGMLLNNYDKILKHFDEHFYSDKKTKFKDYKNIYSDVVNNKLLNKDLINHFLNIIKNMKEGENDDIMKTMRMCMFEL